MQAKTRTTFKGRLWKNVDVVSGDGKLCPDFGTWAEPAQGPRGLYQGSGGCCRDRQHVWLLGARAVPRLSLGAPADAAGRRKRASSHESQRSLPRGCSHLRETRREVSGLKQRITGRTLSVGLRVRLSMCARTGSCQRQKERLCAYTRTSHLRLRHPPVYFSLDKYSMNCNKHPKNSKQLIIHHCLLLWLQARI